MDLSLKKYIAHALNFEFEKSMYCVGFRACNAEMVRQKVTISFIASAPVGNRNFCPGQFSRPYPSSPLLKRPFGPFSCPPFQKEDAGPPAGTRWPLPRFSLYFTEKDLASLNQDLNQDSFYLVPSFYKG